MRKIILTLYISLICLGLAAQQPRFIFSEPTDSTNVRSNVEKLDTVAIGTTATVAATKDSITLPAIYAWKINSRFGDRILIDRDTTHLNFHTQSLVDNKDIAVGYLGNIGSPALSKIYFNRSEKSKFSFLDAFDYYRKDPTDNQFLNTKQPYSNIYYQSGGGKQSKEEHLKFELSMNFGKKINVGMNLDYLYARGFYENLFNKQFNYDAYGSYIDEKFEIQAFFANNYFNNSENGGILNDKNLGETPSIPSLDMATAIRGVFNKLSGRHIFLTGKYNLGLQEETDIPIASIIYTTHYTDQKRKLLAKNAIIDKSIYPELPIGGINIDEHFAYWSFKNTFAISLNEGFRDWVKFGLRAFIEQDIRKYSVPKDDFPMFNNNREQDETRIGGALTKKQGQFLQYDLSVDIAVLGYNLSEFNIIGDIATSIPIKGKYATLKAKGYIKSLKPTFFENYYSSSMYSWQNDFKDTRKVYVGGELNIPHTGTTFRGGVENISRLIYVGSDKILKQHGEDIQIVSLELEQRLKAGILHWDNRVVYQSSPGELPLPELSVYSNVYIQTSLAKVLKIQLGFDARFHTAYYAPAYNPLTVQFYNQKDVKVGNFPITTAYANLHLKKTRFFLMMYNVTGQMGNSEYFSLPHYPVNPMIFKFGLSWNFVD